MPSILQKETLERIWILAKADFHIRYYGSVLGLLWALLNPLAKLTVYYFVFTNILNSQVENFAIYMFSGMTIWMIFAESSNAAINILRQKRYLIESINVNKLEIFTSSMLNVLLGFSFNFSMLLLFCLVLQTDISIWALAFPIVLLSAVLFSMAVSMLLSTLNIFIRDTKHIWDIVIIAGFWTLPIIWDQDVLYEKVPFLLYIHPLTGTVINTRNLFIYGSSPDMFLLFYDLLYGVIAFLVALFIMNKFSHKAIENG